MAWLVRTIGYSFVTSGKTEKVWREGLLGVAHKYEDEMVKLYRHLVSTWEHGNRIKWKARVGIRANRISSRVWTNDPIFNWLDQGTLRRFAIMKRSPLFIPKTRYRQLTSDAGQGGLAVVRTDIGSRESPVKMRAWRRKGSKDRTWKSTETAREAFLKTPRELRKELRYIVLPPLSHKEKREHEIVQGKRKGTIVQSNVWVNDPYGEGIAPRRFTQAVRDLLTKHGWGFRQDIAQVTHEAVIMMFMERKIKIAEEQAKAAAFKQTGRKRGKSKTFAKEMAEVEYNIRLKVSDIERIIRG